MKNLEVNSLGLMELDARELVELDGGYVPGDVVTDSDGLMRVCTMRYEGGGTTWKCLGTYAA